MLLPWPWIRCFNPGSDKIIIIFSNGGTSSGIAESQAAKAAGIEIYAVGIGRSVNVNMLNAWASEPISTHVYISPSSADLAEIIKQIAAMIIEPAALNITLIDIVDRDFKILDAMVSKGTIEIIRRKLIWNVPDLGASGEETITLNAKVKYYGRYAGFQQVHEYMNYSDDENHRLYFPNPVIYVVP